MDYFRQVLAACKWLFLSLLLSAFTLAGASWWLSKNFSRDIALEQAKENAGKWTAQLTARLPRLERILAGGRISTSEFDTFRRIESPDPIFHFSIFDLEGSLRFSTLSEDQEKRNYRGQMALGRISEENGTRLLVLFK